MKYCTLVQVLVFGGILSLAGKFLMPFVTKELEQCTLRWNRESTQVALARHGFDACVLGGVAAIYQMILAEPNLMGMPVS